MIPTLLDSLSNIKNNYKATTAPTVSDDLLNGYSIGSQWINTSTNALYVCFDNSQGAAVWINIGAGGTSFKGAWDASTNTPTLADGVGVLGDFYLVSVAGTQDLGSGSIVFTVGDQVIYNGTIWQKIESGVDYIAENVANKATDFSTINDVLYPTVEAVEERIDSKIGNAYDFNAIQYPASLEINSPTHLDNLQKTVNHIWSAGVIEGCGIVDNGDGTIDIEAGTLMIRGVATSDADLYSVKFLGQSNLAITDNVITYIYIDYNSGNPIFVATTSSSVANGLNKTIAHQVRRKGSVIDLKIDVTNQNTDLSNKIRQQIFDTQRFPKKIGGSQISETGTRNLAITAGSYYYNLAKITHPAFDTSIAGTANENVFTLTYRDGAGGFTEVLNEKQLSNAVFDNGSGTPASISGSKYCVNWIYLCHNSPTQLWVVMGQSQYNNIADAQAATIPSQVSPAIIGFGSLLGFVIIRQGEGGFTEILSIDTNQFKTTTPITHNNLSGLQGGLPEGGDEFYHLTLEQYSGFANLDPSTLIGANASSNIESLSTATYPSLTEISRVKGLTSPVQTQLDAKPDSFLELTDTPSSYSGSANKITVVNPSETAVEFTDIGALIAAIPYGAVGSMALLVRTSVNDDVIGGSTYAGSELKPIGVIYYNGRTSNGYYSNLGPSTMSGTWRALGYCDGNPLDSTGGFNQGTLFVRIL